MPNSVDGKHNAERDQPRPTKIQRRNQLKDLRKPEQDEANKAASCFFAGNQTNLPQRQRAVAETEQTDKRDLRCKEGAHLSLGNSLIFLL